jgi:hypothetical protein
VIVSDYKEQVTTFIKQSSLEKLTVAEEAMKFPGLFYGNPRFTAVFVKAHN